MIEVHDEDFYLISYAQHQIRRFRLTLVCDNLQARAEARLPLSDMKRIVEKLQCQDLTITIIVSDSMTLTVEMSRVTIW